MPCLPYSCAVQAIHKVCTQWEARSAPPCCSHGFCWFLCYALGGPRPDPTFDRLIAKVYPNLEAFEAQEEAEIQQSNLQHNFHNAFTESSRKAAEQQKINRLVCGTHHTFAVACT